MMQLRDKFISLLVKAVNNHAIYLWSAQGEKVIDLSEEEIKMKYETSEANAKRVINHINMLKQYNWLTSKTKAYDCSGLICHCLSSCKRESENFDLCADDLIKRYNLEDNVEFVSGQRGDGVIKLMTHSQISHLVTVDNPFCMLLNLVC